MQRKALKGDELKADSFENYVLENGFGIPVALSSAPTTTGNQLPRHGDAGYHSTNLYVNLGGTTYRLSMTAV